MWLCIFYVYVIAMFRRIFMNLSSYRRRLLLIRLFTAFFLVFIIILWIRRPSTEPSSNNPFAQRKHYDKSEVSIGDDEFLAPVLEKYKWIEIDLSKRGMDVAPMDDYDAEIKEDEKTVVAGLGTNGESAKVPEFQTSVADAILKKEAFNRLLSDMISPNRTVPDTRESSCRGLTYDISSLPSASVVIIYTDEAFSSLIRTLHSVFNRTPASLLHEVILVDDFSQHRDLKGKLQRYLATHFPIGKIRLIRLEERAGLIRARLIGAYAAKGQVLVFLDAHCETVQSWLEPLLQRIDEERTAVVCPIIDVIDDKTLEYSHGNGAFFQIGGFTWSGHFTWINIPPQESRRKKYHHSPTRSPTMAGGLFAIDRAYFWEIGSYDSEMQLWGGENLEMSFRVWQCGGSVEIIPCSRVGHIFRSFHPYTFPGNVDSHGLNTARLVEVWMDEYKDIFYSHRQELKTANLGDVSKRLRLREKLKCKSFTWYLDHVFPEKFRLWFGSQLHGQFKNEGKKKCLDNMSHGDSEEYSLNVYPCHPVLYPSQTFYLSNNFELRRETECAIVRDGSSKIEMVSCESHDTTHTWSFDPGKGQFKHKDGKCLSVGENNDDVIIEICEDGSLKQKWTITNSNTKDN